MSDLVNAQAFWKLAEAMGMEPDAFRNKYHLDAPFHALVTVALAALAEKRDEPAVADQREQWRTGRHPTHEPGPRQRTIYGPDGELRGVMFTTEDARLVVGALNGLAAAREEAGRLREALEELVRRGSDFRREAYGEDPIAVGADIMLRAALKDAEAALGLEATDAVH